jgi:putative spermidine/putrescine transport system ATP-binding protein
MTPASASSPAVRVEGLRIRYGATEVVKGVGLEVAAGEIVSLLGPSGCGKTTTLRAIAGFAQPDEGNVLLHGQDVTELAPNRRDIGMVFQGYALFPHLSVFDNVAYGLRMRKLPRAEIAQRVGRALELVKLSAFADRRPKQLSGGQQQRVAIARALVIEPKVLLLDEPLSNLDAKLRQEMRLELRRLLKATHVASIFVTHDQEEAIILSDRIILMNDGRIEQEGTPQAMYERPRSLFAAAFLGQANFLQGRVRSVDADGTATIEVEGQVLRGAACPGLAPGAPATLVVKCERVQLGAPDAAGASNVRARFEIAGFLGASVQVQCLLGDQRVVAMVPSVQGIMQPPTPESTVVLGWREADALIFPRGT